MYASMDVRVYFFNKHPHTSNKALNRSLDALA